MVLIRTERLLLRHATRADLVAMHAILGDPQAMAFWSTPPHRDLADTQDWLSAMIAIDPAVGEDFVVEHRGAVIGKVGLYRFPDIGFIFRPDAWGKGFAGEALRAIADRAFNRHGLAAIRADVDPRNNACLKLLCRLGFREVGRAARAWLVGDRWCDSIYLQLDAAAWNAREPSRPVDPSPYT